MAAQDVEAVRGMLARLYAGTTRGDLIWSAVDGEETRFKLSRSDGTAAVILSEGADGGYPIHLHLYDADGTCRASVEAELHLDREWDNDLWELFRVVSSKNSPTTYFITEFAADIVVPDDDLPF